MCWLHRRRGVALNAAAGVTEQEWTAAVRLGRASAAAKAVLFDRKRHGNTGMALAAASGAAAAREDNPMQLDEQQQQQGLLVEGDDVHIVGEVDAAADQQQQEHMRDADDDVVMVEDGMNDIPSNNQQQQQQQQAAVAGRGPAAGKLSRKTREVASEALAAVQAAAETYSLQKGRGSRVLKR
jgi:hypothetical protein